MTHHLTVVRDFANFRRGDHIEDEETVARILQGEHRHHVVKVRADVKEPEAKAPQVSDQSVEAKA